jgi:nitrate reductase NapE component
LNSQTRRWVWSTQTRINREGIDMKMRRPMLLLASVGIGLLPLLAVAQALLESAGSSGMVASATMARPDLTYTRPTEKRKIENYLFNAFGPYPALGAALAAGVDQAHNTLPEWKQGAAAYTERFGSIFGIAAITTTTRYALAEAFREDTLYYRCECKGLFPRLRHALISTLSARRGQDGHRVFSFPALIAPYAGSMTAVYAWYPGRYNARDALRMGNHTILGYVGGNIALEFFYSGPHSLLHRMHPNNAHAAPNSGSNP